MLTALLYLMYLIEILCAILLIGVILLQRSKEHGLGGLAFGAGMGETLFGARAGNVLTRATVVLAVVFLVNTALIGKVSGCRRRQSVSIVDRMAPIPAPTLPTPGVPSPPAPLPAPAELPAEGSGAALPSPTPVEP